MDDPSHNFFFVETLDGLVALRSMITSRLQPLLKHANSQSGRVLQVTPCSVNFISMRPLTTSVTALRFATLSDERTEEPFDVLLAGIGNQVHVFGNSSGETVIAATVLPHGERIQGFSEPSGNQVIVHGGRYVATISACVSIGTCTGSIKINACREFRDWVWGGLWTQAGHVLAMACGHSTVAICRSKDLQGILMVECEERELTWCTELFVSSEKSTLTAFGGTSFGDILVWTVLDQIATDDVSMTLHEKPPLDGRLSSRKMTRKPAHRLRGHDGPVMKLKLSSNACRMVSCSVDRSVRVWERSCSGSGCESDRCFVPVHCHYGHLARIWDTRFLDSSSMRVVSVGEDRTCRVWSGKASGQQRAVLYGHAGRNVWSLDVKHINQKCALIATGGEDGCLKVQGITVSEKDDEGSNWQNTTTTNSVSQKSTTYSVRIPGNLPNPRKVGGVHNESGRSIRFIDSNTMLVSTDFGRILVGFIDSNGPSFEKPLVQKTYDEQTGKSISWIELFHDSTGTAYTPASLEYCDGLVFGGRTTGHVTILKVVGLHGDAPVTSKIVEVSVFRQGSGMVMGLFVQRSRVDRVWNLFAATNTGDLYHWRVEDHGEEIVCGYHRTYRQRKTTKTSLVTSVLYVPRHGFVVVGDRGGRVLLYNVTRTESLETNRKGPSADDVVVHPFSVCRPHSDRVSSISVAPEGQITSQTHRETETTVYSFVTTGFDGRIGRLQVDAREMQLEPRLPGNAGDQKSILKVLSSQKSAEHVDTIVRIVFPRSAEGEKFEKESPNFNYERYCMAGFRSADVSIWDVQQRNEVFRANCGNWRRAFDIFVDLSCSSTSAREPQLVVEEMTCVFWRSGRLYIVQRNSDTGHDSSTESNAAIGQQSTPNHSVMAMTPSFHGQRVNAVTWVGGSSTLLTGSEDTTINVMQLGREKWHKLQTLSRHKSGVNTLSTARLATGGLVCFSGGGCDEVVTWTGPGAIGPWRDVCATEIGAKDACGQSRKALHRVLCIASMDGSSCSCASACAMAMVGRSDGSVALVRSAPCARGAYRQAGKEWESAVVQVALEHGGAVLCCAATRAMVGGEAVVIAASGDSQGSVVLWATQLERPCGERRARVLHRWERLHDGGVNAVGVAFGADSGGKGGVVVVASGGDDERVRITTAGVHGEDGEERVGVRGEAPAGARAWRSPRGTHTAAVTGVCFAAGGTRGDEWWVATGGADQRVNWVHVSHARGAVDARVVQGVGGRVNVADVGAVAARVVSAEAGVRGSAVVVGCGMESVECWLRGGGGGG